MSRVSFAVVLLLVALFAGESEQRGTLYLNEIQATLDPITDVEQLAIESTLWDDNIVFLDSFDSISNAGVTTGEGVLIDGILINEGTWVFPGDFSVGGVVTVDGLLQINGGFTADDSTGADDDDNDISFSIENDTGNTFIAGSLTVNGGINNGDVGTFNVGVVGETLISGVISPDGGVNVNNGAAVIGVDGSMITQASLTVLGDLIIGTDLAEARNFIPFTNGDGVVPPAGGSTTLFGQDASTIGGDFVLSPGFGVGTSINKRSGDVLFGIDNRVHDLTISRVGPATGNAGALIFGGQNAAGKGGDLRIEGGSGGANSVGGDVIFTPGQSASGLPGLFYLGDPVDGPNIPFFVQRPVVSNSANAAATFIGGQNVTAGNSGTTAITAGDGTLVGGNVYLQPGTSGNEQGRIVFRNEVSGPTVLRLVRDQDLDSTVDAGSTWLIGQDSAGGSGGNIELEAGAGSSVFSGDLNLSPGASAADPISGTIFWGGIEGQDDLQVVRPTTSDSPAHDTTFAGAAANNGGGELNLFGGSGLDGGDVQLLAGIGEQDNGGNVNLAGGQGATSGGTVNIIPGDSVGGISGRVTFNSGGAASGATPGSIFLSAVGNDVFFNAGELLLESVPVFYDNTGQPGDFILNNGIITVTIRAGITPALGLITLDNFGVVDNLIRDRISLTSNFRPVTDPYDDTLQAATELFDALTELRDGLTAHGLIITL